MDMSRDNGLVVDLAHENKAPYVFSGAVKAVVFDLKPATTHDDEKSLHEHASIHGSRRRGLGLNESNHQK